MKLRGMDSPLPNRPICSMINHGRIMLNEATLRYAVLHRTGENKRNGNAVPREIVLIEDFSVTFPILLSQIQSHENNTLRNSQMTLVDGDEKVIGVAKPISSQWKFTNYVHIYPNKTYKFIINNAIVYSGKCVTKREFHLHSSDIKFKGKTSDAYLRFAYWPAYDRSLDGSKF